MISWRVSNLTTKEDKLKAVQFYLTEVLVKSYPLEMRKKEFLRQFKHYKNFYGGHPEFSDLWGIELDSLNDITMKELNGLLKQYEED